MRNSRLFVKTRSSNHGAISEGAFFGCSPNTEDRKRCCSRAYDNAFKSRENWSEVFNCKNKGVFYRTVVTTSANGTSEHTACLKTLQNHALAILHDRYEHFGGFLTSNLTRNWQEFNLRGTKLAIFLKSSTITRLHRRCDS